MAKETSEPTTQPGTTEAVSPVGSQTAEENVTGVDDEEPVEVDESVSPPYVRLAVSADGILTFDNKTYNLNNYRAVKYWQAPAGVGHCFLVRVGANQMQAEDELKVSSSFEAAELEEACVAYWKSIGRGG